MAGVKEMADRMGMHCYVSGKVQGVWFRASTQTEAERLSITGWARNLPDGRVEVMAFGDKDKLAELHTWLKQGPRLASVTDVTREELPWQPLNDFKTL
jgi:acylphosphatase